MNKKTNKKSQSGLIRKINRLSGKMLTIVGIGVLAVVATSGYIIVNTSLASSNICTETYQPSNLYQRCVVFEQQLLGRVQNLSTGSEVRGLKVDGYYGNNTITAVKSFQRDINLKYAGTNLEISGRLGTKTIYWLCAESSLAMRGTYNIDSYQSKAYVNMNCPNRS